jgi:hypothetical protein
MPDVAGIDFNSADHHQRKLLRVALMNLFRERGLAMFLDEEMGLILRDEVDDGPFREQVYELIHFLIRRGRLDDLMRALLANQEYAEAPGLRDLVVAWSPVSTEAGTEPPQGGPSAAPIDRILDGEVRRMRPMSWVSGIAAIRRRVCLLRRNEAPLASGFLAAPDLVMTAGYVLSLSDGKLDAVFDYGIGAAEARVAQTLGIEETTVLVPGPPELDYALLRLAEPAGEQKLEDGTTRGWFDVADARERLREGESVFMVHHPQGGAMSLSEGVIGSTPADSSRLVHSCPTAPGSGGAPLIDATLRLVGVHELKLQDGKQAVRMDWIARDLVQRGVKVSVPPAREAA